MPDRQKRALVTGITGQDGMYPTRSTNLAAITFVALSFEQAEATANVTGLGAVRMLEALRSMEAGRTPSASTRPRSASSMAGFARRQRLGCKPEVGFDALIKMMVELDLEIEAAELAA